MAHFSYVRAESIGQAVALLNEPGVSSRPLAGGTDLMLLARRDPFLCDRVVDISLIPEMHRVEQAGDRITIGAGATFSEVMESPIVQETAAVLAQACEQIGAVQIRNMGTIGGNVANAAACADSLPALVCLDATASMQTPEGELICPVADLVLGPNHTRILHGGLLTSFSYTVPARGSRSTFLKLGRRNAMAISRLTVAALGRLHPDGTIAEVRLVPGSAVPQIQRFSAVETGLLGQAPDEALLQMAAQWSAEEMIRLADRRWSSEFKEPALIAMVARALRKVFGLGQV